MNTKSLPPRPDLSQLKKQANELLKELQQDPLSVKKRIEEFHPRYNKEERRPFDPADIKHADALLVVAREYGFSSWNTLKWHVETILLDREERVIAFIRAAGRGDLKKAQLLLEQDPSLPSLNIVTASITGEVDTVTAFLKNDPSLCNTKCGKINATPLFYLCHSHLHKLSPKHADGILQTATLLLDHGADPNTSIPYPEDPKHQLSALYGACGEAYYPSLARLLIERGANVDDNESLYHSTEHRDHECTKLLLESGAKIEGSNAVFHMLDYEDVEGLQLLLSYRPKPDDRLIGDGTMLHHAVLRFRSNEILGILLDYGVDIHAKNKHGYTAYLLARRLGNSNAAEFLLQRGAKDDLNETQRFLAACAGGDEPYVQSVLDKTPDFVKNLPPHDMRILADAAEMCHHDAVRVMLEAGFDVSVRGVHGATALHWAAWMGIVETVKLLLQSNAPMDILCHTFGCTPLMWAAHGADHCRNPKGDYVAVVQALLDAGSDIGLRNKWNELLLPQHNDPVAEYLIANGAELPQE